MAAVRPQSGGTGKPVLPSATEMYESMGLGPRQAAGLESMLGDKVISNQFMSTPVSASGGEFFEVVSLADVKGEYYDPMDYDEVSERNLAGKPVWTLDENWIYIDDNGKPVEKVSGRKIYDSEFNTNRRRYDVTVPGLPEAHGAQGDEGPAKLTVVPTTTSNPDRPRTVAAGYDKSREVITVVFRDGTFYNYYQVSPREWQDFKARVSKGRYIYKFLDFKPRGPADLSTVPSYARNTLYRLARGVQVKKYGTEVRNRKKR